MGIKIFIAICLIRSIVFSQGTESQRKYSAQNMDAFKTFITNSGTVNEFKTYYHSELVTTDIYLDTPEKDLFNRGLSLRFRRRMATPDSAVYSFQLKTEMMTLQGIRTEVDEPELDFYQVILDDYQTTLPVLLDSLFYACEPVNSSSNKARKKYIDLLQLWMQQKARAPIAPFQKLTSLYPNPFPENQIGSLAPVCIGTSKRLRSHIYIDLKNYSGQFGKLFKNPEAVKEKLAFFELNENAIWVMESSLDSSVFKSLLNTEVAEFAITEYEVENKYQHDDVGTVMMNAFENWIIDNFTLSKTMNSKYRQSMLSFGY